MTSPATNTTVAAGSIPGQWQPPYELHGYHRMARMMGLSDNMAIFRRFNDLNMLSLLELQAEIQMLRETFYTQCQEDQDQKYKYSTSMKTLRESASTNRPEQYKQLLLIRERMAQYSQ